MALVFSCVAGVLGVAVVAWYGLVDEGQGKGSYSSAGAGGVLQQREQEGGDGQGGVEEVTVTSGGGSRAAKG